MNRLSFVNAPAPVTDSAARALAALLEDVPADTVSVDVMIRDKDTVRGTVAVRVDNDSWEIGIGGYYERNRRTYESALGAGVSLSWGKG